jgi:RHS repeat-associated protein
MASASPGLTDDEGDVVDGYTYDVFGAIRAQSGSSDNYWLFTGEQREADFDLYYLRARYYDPETGRFLSQDPLFGRDRQTQTQNPYPYVMNNPLNLRDPYGLCALCDLVKDNVVDPIDDNIIGPVGEVVTETVPEAAQWTYQNIARPIYDYNVKPAWRAVRYCSASIDRAWECYERTELVLAGSAVALAGGIIVGAGCVLVPAALSPAGPGGWALAGVVCLEASVGGAAAGYAGFWIIQAAVSPWEHPKE